MFGDRMRQLRLEKGLTQEELGRLVGRKKQAVNNWENNRRVPEAAIIVEIARLLNCTSDYLLGISEYRNARLVTPEELKEFLPPEIEAENIHALVSEAELSETTKQEILQLLKKHGYIK